MQKHFLSSLGSALVALLLGAASIAAQAAGGTGVAMDHFPDERLTNLASLQNGARIFANHCLNCHGASLMRWNRLRDIGLDEKQIRDYLIFGDQKVGDTMKVALAPADAKAWFGKVPPDLSVITRARTSFDYLGTDYLYTLLRGYYRDASSATGWNNVAYPNIAMPHVLWQQQGPREATIDRVAYADGKPVRTVSVYDANGNLQATTTPLSGHPAESVQVNFKPADPAAARQFDSDVADLVAYLTFMTDPSAVNRVRVGVWVMLFLVLFIAVAWWLNRTYWKSIK